MNGLINATKSHIGRFEGFHISINEACYSPCSSVSALSLKQVGSTKAGRDLAKQAR